MWLKFWLQDPTGTIGASIHSKALSEGEFGKSISVGAVLVLQKVRFLFFLIDFLKFKMISIMNICIDISDVSFTLEFHVYLNTDYLLRVMI